MRLWIGLLLACVALPVLAEARFSFDSTPGQLPKDIVPRHYHVRIKPDTTNFTFNATERIDFEVLKPAGEIVLNAADIEVQKAWLGKDTTPLGVKLDAATQTMKVALPAPLKPGKYSLHLDYTGKISSQAHGLFYLKYNTPAGEKLMLGTQMAPADARRLFPSWDEPVFRATFALSVLVPDHLRAVSNMPVASEKPLRDSWKEIAFQTTPSMPTYLVALAIGELEEITDEVDGIRLRIVAPAGKARQGRYAMDVTKQVVRYYNDYFGQKYPLPKLDQIALPGAPGYAAMENWGAIIYLESVLLFDPAVSSPRTRERIHSVVAHEIAHQWFGNLVTMAWWDNVWLNEGFATWIGNKATERFNPAWQWTPRLKRYTEFAMRDDARKTTHPIQQPVTNASQALDAFDDITYTKGRAFLQMLESWLGEDTFRRGIRAYVAAHRFSNTTTADLWYHLEAATGKPVRAIAAPWTEQPGFPLVNASAACRDGKTVVSLVQERFTLNDPSAAPLTWKIPLTLAYGPTPVGRRAVLLDAKPETVTFEGCGGYVKVNPGDTGYYRVAYDTDMFTALNKNLSALPVVDRLGLLADAWALAEAGRRPATQYLELAEALKEETALPIWENLIETLAWIDRLQAHEPGRVAYRAWVISLLRPQLRGLGWNAAPGEDFTTGQLRSKVIEALGQFGDEEIIREARQRFGHFLAAPETLSPELRRAVLLTVGRHAEPAEHERLRALMQKAIGIEEKQLYLQALQVARAPVLAEKTLGLSLTEELGPTDAARNPGRVAEEGEHVQLAWDFLSANFKTLRDKSPSLGRNSLAGGVAEHFSDSAHAKELEDFVQASLDADAIPETAKAADAVRLAAQVKARALPEIDAWVRAQR